MRPVHPGEVLREDFLVPRGVGVNAPALAQGIPATRIAHAPRALGFVHTSSRTAA